MRSSSGPGRHVGKGHLDLHQPVLGLGKRQPVRDRRLRARGNRRNQNKDGQQGAHAQSHGS